MENYTGDEVGKIISAYRDLFPIINTELGDYWDFGHLRQWSLLTTNFHSIELSTLQTFDKAARSLDEVVKRQDKSHLLRSADAQFIWAKKYRELAVEYRLGYSLGISPITDDLLCRTFNTETTRIVILVGHDWYPIITTAPNGIDLFLPVPPLRKYSVLDEKSYEPAVRPLMGVKDCSILFINLYPDFRGPGVDKLGSLDNYPLWVRGFGVLCESISPRFELAGVISWGSQVWQALQKTLISPFNKLGVMAAVEEQYKRGKPLFLKFGKVMVPYFPFAHPSFATNFKKKSHWAAYQEVCSGLVNRRYGTL